ncbi:flagellar assembly peptidoglycan hydrolase FlgJ [Pusillimonas sp. TS35]|uniref:flagellar assembly peptidoglycan hydrolase FlgJ n=1 Tax=Paracandidimonas lactea TaxID=2895524 RepID=UPI001369D448|nr:flagellar assembly peptidoglycan hydrolase FlgJ [Paracandidimonas lactea]MYN11642.1 flagellar assembly peptidoglycan hydrolase FlgJ [Pusillimonas sp. TS35]
MGFVRYIPRPGEGAGSTLDFSGLNALRRGLKAGGNTPAAEREIAQQFEALFIQQMLKQARSADGMGTLLDSQQTRLAQSMSDEQMALQLSEKGIGLAEALLAQIRSAGSSVDDAQLGAQAPELAASRLPGLRSRMPDERSYEASSITTLLEKLTGGLVRRDSIAGRAISAIEGAPKHIRDFVASLGDAARTAARESGLPEKLVLSQAALESGWGKREIRGEDGASSYNLFGIKAGASWKGKVVHVMTTEYENGVPRKLMQPFRAYDSYAESFADYARLITQSTRYSAVTDAGSAEEAARRIQEAGYATDPAYAEKLISIMSYFDHGTRTHRT